MTIIGDLLYKLYETFFLVYEIKKNKVGYINLFHGIFEFISSKFPVE